MAQSLKPGQILQNTIFPRMQAVIEVELQPQFYTWYLARPAADGTCFVKYGFARFSEIDSLSWTTVQ